METLLPLDCSFTYTLEEVNLSGGHEHNSQRPIGGLRLEKGSGNGSSILAGQTEYQYYKIVEYLAPQVSGEVIIHSSITPPRGYVCVNPPDCRYEGTVDIQVTDLQPMPASGDYHVVVRLGTDTHPEGSYGTSDTIKILRKIAKEYFKNTGRRLSINDLSLPKGGLFDINSDNTTSHIEHRIGTDADLNRCDESGQFCPTCKFLREVVQIVAQGQLKPSLKCESEGKKHIDFD